uniref:Uncharacterized protein n=1 Tax=Megaselia scalaris TaxID=36166 RepID=T1GRK7_MEGSC
MPGDEDRSDKKKSHRARHSGVSAEKKKLKKTKSVGKDETLTARQRNPKAFAINSAISAERNFRRKEDLTRRNNTSPLWTKPLMFLHQDVTREQKVFKPLKIPKTLQRSLPYKDKPKHAAVDGVKDEERIAVILSPHEQKVNKMMKMIKTNFEDKKNKEKMEMNERARKFKAEQEQEKVAYHKRQQNLKRKMCRAISKVKGKSKS